MGRKPKTILAIHKGILYVKADYCGIHTLIILADGFAFHDFPGEKHVYLKADDCLAWLRKELEYGESHGYKKAELDRYRQSIAAYDKAMTELAGDLT